MKLKELLKDFLDLEISSSVNNGILKFPEKIKEETITIKKHLWDEMLAYKKVMDDLIIENSELEKKVNSLTYSVNAHFRVYEIDKHNMKKTIEELGLSVRELQKQATNTKIPTSSSNIRMQLD